LDPGENAENLKKKVSAILNLFRFKKRLKQWRRDTRQNDTGHNDIQHKSLNYPAALSITTLTITTFNIIGSTTSTQALNIKET
jgi:hypothetical protein